MGKFITGTDRNQLVLFQETLEERIEEYSYVRVMDIFVESLNLQELGFKSEPSKKGTNEYNPKDLLKLYLYGYRNKVRSSRKLEEMCKVNIEVIWLMKGIKPNFRTIADFRKENKKKFKEVFKKVVLLCKEMELVENEWSEDGVKIKAVNAKERNYTLNKIDDRIKGVEKRIEEYLKELDKNDKEEKEKWNEEKIKEILKKDKKEIRKIITEKMKKVKKGKKREKKKKIIEKIEKKEKLEKIRRKMEKRGESQISLTDKEARLMKNNGKFEVCYNNQVLVDGGSHIVVNYEVDNQPADVGHITKISKEAKEYLGKEIVKNILDKGYNDREDMAESLKEGIIPEVTLPEGKEEYIIEIVYKEHKKGKGIKESLERGIVPKELEEYVRIKEIKEKTEIESKKITNKEIEEMSEDELRDFAMKNKCFIKDKERNKVYCKEGETLRKKSEIKGGEKYCNKEACRRCKNPCTEGSFKEVLMRRGSIICTQDGKLRKEVEKVKERKKKKIKVVEYRLKPKEEDIRKRMSISEHSHGTMKRTDNMDYLLIKGKEGATAELGIYYAASNMRRLINIKGGKEIIEHIKRKKGEI